MKKKFTWTALAVFSDEKIKHGYFQIIGVDLLYDSDWHAVVTEWNHECGFKINNDNEKYIKPKTMNETMDIFLNLYEHEDNLHEYLQDIS